MGETYHPPDPFRRASRYRALFHDDRAWFGVGCDLAHRAIKGRHVCGAASTNAKRLRWSVDCHHDDVCSCNSLCGIACEEQVLRAARQGRSDTLGGCFTLDLGTITDDSYDGVQARFVYGQMW